MVYFKSCITVTTHAVNTCLQYNNNILKQEEMYIKCIIKYQLHIMYKHLMEKHVTI